MRACDPKNDRNYLDMILHFFDHLSTSDELVVVENRGGVVSMYLELGARKINLR